MLWADCVLNILKTKNSLNVTVLLSVSIVTFVRVIGKRGKNVLTFLERGELRSLCSQIILPSLMFDIE